MSEQLEASNVKQQDCAAMTRSGTYCRALALPGRSLCWSHDPGLKARREEARRTGGQNRSNAARIRRLVPPRLVSTFDRLETALEDVLVGRLDPKQATAAASVARAMTAVLMAGELEERLRRLEGHEDGGS